jgi:hypothetical protein
VVSFPQVTPPKSSIRLCLFYVPYSARLFLLGFITWTIFDEEYRSDASHYAFSFSILSCGLSQSQISAASYSHTISIQYYHFLYSSSLLIQTLLIPVKLSGKLTIMWERAIELNVEEVTCLATGRNVWSCCVAFAEYR